MNLFSTKSKRFLVIVVHSNEIGLAYVQDGRIGDTARFNFSRALSSRAYTYPTITSVWPQINAYFDKVDHILAYNMVVHKTNLKEMLAYHGLELPRKKYVCVYYWARAVLGTTSLKSLYNVIHPDVPAVYGELPYRTDSAYQAELIARIALYLQNKQSTTTSLTKQNLEKQVTF